MSATTKKAAAKATTKKAADSKAAPVYESQVEINLKTRVTMRRLGWCADQVVYQLQASDIEACYTAAEIKELDAMQARLYQLANQAGQYVADKKAGQAAAAPSNGTAAKVEGKTMAELRDLYQDLTGGPAPKSWRTKAALIEGIHAA